ncbi:hypothetical protein [Streptomyces nitrosporeus]|uniref:hypothetical protein n=1 Tax=Streptomyces nitrosporeus TaxID=28894 RepID=UPI0039A10563
MTVTTLDFVLQGRDALTHTLNQAGDAANRLRRRLDDAANDSSRALAGFTRDANGQLRDLQGRFISTADAAARMRDGVNSSSAPFVRLRESAEKFGDQLKSSVISLAPAAIPAVAGLAGAAAAVGAQLGTAGVAAGAYALALGPQISAITEAREAHTKYEEAVAKSGRTSKAAAEAQVDYQRKLAALPPETREAAIAVGLLADGFEEWSDSLAGDVMGPFTKGVAVTNALLPRTSGLVQGTSAQFDRLITLVGGAVASPGFDQLADRFTVYSERTLRNAVDGTTEFFATLDQGGAVGGGLAEFFDMAREAGPVVGDTLRNVGEAVLHILDGASGVGVGMLDLINALSAVVAAVPPGAIAALLQMAIAIKAVKIAAAAGAAGQAALAVLTGQLVLMRTAAAAAPGRLAAVGAAIGTLSKTAKLAVAGTGIGLLLILLSELSQSGEDTAPDVDKLSTSLAKFGATGKVSGEAASVLGKDFEKLRDQLSKVIDPSIVESINNWGADITGGFLDAGEATEEFNKNAKAVDESLAALVSGGKADLAAAALSGMLETMNPEQADKLTTSLGDYNAALDAMQFEQQLAAEAQGMFGAQALEVQASLQAQKDSADGLRQSIQALNDVQRSGLGGMIGFEAAIDAATKAAKENAGVLDMHGGKLTLTTERQRAAASALTDLAAKTDSAAAAARESGASWEEVAGIYDQGRGAFLRSAQAMGLTEGQARSLANQIMQTPDKTAYLRGDLDDLKAKLADAKERLAKAPSSKTAKIRGEISDLKRKIAEGQAKVDAMHGKTITITTQFVTVGDGSAARRSGAYGAELKYASGGLVGFPGGGLIQGPGTTTSDSILIAASTGEYVVKAASVSRYGLEFMHALNSGTLPTGRAAPSAGRPAAVMPTATTSSAGPAVTYNLYPRASVISVEDLRLVQRQEEARQRVGRPR